MKEQVIYNKKFPTVMLVDAVQLLDGYKVHVTFTNGQARDIDLDSHMRGPVFEEIRKDPALFRQVFVDDLSKTLTWPNGVDLDPESLYYGDQPPPWMADYESSPSNKSPRQLRERATRKTTKRRVVTKKIARKNMTKKQSNRKQIPQK